jgi:hypothetical protein
MIPVIGVAVVCSVIVVV